MPPAKGRIQRAASKQAEMAVNEKTARAFGLSRILSENYECNGPGHVYLVLKYFDSTFECFSDWAADELRELSSLIRQLRALTWDQLYKHHGIRPKKIDLKTITDGKEELERAKTALSPDIEFTELRVTKEIRLHGFRIEDAFFLVLLDRAHRVYQD